MPPWGELKTRRRKNKNDHGSAVSRKCPKFRAFLQGNRLSIFCPIGIKSYPAITVLSPGSGYGIMLTSFSQFQALGCENWLSWLRFTVGTLPTV